MESVIKNCNGFFKSVTGKKTIEISNKTKWHLFMKVFSIGAMQLFGAKLENITIYNKGKNKNKGIN